MKTKLLSIFLAVFIITLLAACNKTHYLGCPDTELYDFEQKVESKEQAAELFKQYFSENQGPIFNESLVVYDEYKEGYRYMLYVIKTDGELIQKGYCK